MSDAAEGTSAMHVFRVLEDDFVTHHVAATTEQESVETVLADSEGTEFEAVQLPDDRIFTMTLVDSPCDPEDPDVAEWIGRDGFTVDLSGIMPTVSAACATWAASCKFPQVLTCSEW